MLVENVSKVLGTPVMRQVRPTRLAAQTLMEIRIRPALAGTLGAPRVPSTQEIAAEVAVLRDELRAKDESLGLIAHELRNPLNVLTLAARRLLLPGMVTPGERATIESIAAVAARLTLLLDDMLVLARGEEPELEPLLLQRVLPASVARHEAAFPSRELLYDVPIDLPVVIGHAGWIGQVVDNLIGNAEKYSPANRRILVTARAEGRVVSILVFDEGAGVSDDNAANLFLPFHREASALGLPGLGLGLTVCKRMVDQMGGRIWARSRPGGGSEFGFSLAVEQMEPVVA